MCKNPILLLAIHKNPNILLVIIIAFSLVFAKKVITVLSISCIFHFQNVVIIILLYFLVISAAQQYMAKALILSQPYLILVTNAANGVCGKNFQVRGFFDSSREKYPQKVLKCNFAVCNLTHSV